MRPACAISTTGSARQFTAGREHPPRFAANIRAVAYTCSAGLMDSLQIVVLAIVQGITEFLPISSSGHLILVPYFTNWPDQGLEFDLAVHIGTLAAIVAYFRRTLMI